MTVFPLQQHRHTKILNYYRKVLVSTVRINAYRLNGTTRINSRKFYVTYAERSRQLLHKYEVLITDLLLNPHKSFLTHFIRLHLQEDWTAGPPALLKTIKPTLSSWKSSYWPNRRHEQFYADFELNIHYWRTVIFIQIQRHQNVKYVEHI